MAVKILEDLCDCRPTVAENLLQIGFNRRQADDLSAIIKDEVEREQPVEGRGTYDSYILHSHNMSFQLSVTGNMEYSGIRNRALLESQH